jgi:diguanylate cyclase (GGDEF)-like protein/PAS domain S-box-containing protein
MPHPHMQIEDSWILNALMENTADSIYIKDRQCRLWRVGKKMAMDLGVSEPDEIYGKTDVELFGKEFGKKTMIDDLDVMETGQPKIGLVEKYINKRGETNWTSTTKLPLHNNAGEVIGLLGITREINDLKGSEIEFQWLATHDPLTSLANRYLLLDHIEQAIFHTNRNKRFFALLFIDLNGFKQINDTNGHDSGDHYLQVLAKVLLENVRGSDTVARIGGDEFVILLEGLTKAENASKLAKKFSELFKSNTDLEGRSITAAIGVSIYPIHGKDPESLLKTADQAMYKSKKTGSPFTVA